MPEPCDVLVVGAGPAGLAAAAAAGRCARVTLLDAQPRAGGQVWRHDVAHPSTRSAARALEAARAARQYFGVRVVDADPAARTLRIESADGARELAWRRLIIATGAHELFLPFPGWTLPGVSGAGGLQALAKQGWPVAGKRVVLGGSGPLLLAAAASLRAHGADVLAIVEAAPWCEVSAFARGLWRWPTKLVQAAALRARLRGVPTHYGALVTAARGDGGVLRGATIERDGARFELACDLLGVGYGLVPEIALARMLGCALTPAVHPAIGVDALQRTGVEGILGAGECCGVGGVDKARIEGAIAGHVAVGSEREARGLLRASHRARGFGSRLAQAFGPTARARALADAATIVCRCEDVTFGALRGCTDARAAKLDTRCGMGPCQGRICGAALAEMLDWRWHGNPRAPAFPARLATLALGAGGAAGDTPGPQPAG